MQYLENKSTKCSSCQIKCQIWWLDPVCSIGWRQITWDESNTRLAWFHSVNCQLALSLFYDSAKLQFMQSDINQVIVLSIDGLGANLLGPFGNTWIPTPNLNRLAASSILFDHVIAPDTSLEQSLNQIWNAGPKPLIRTLGELGVRSTLASDDSQVTESEFAIQFDSCTPFESCQTLQFCSSGPLPV